MPNNMGPSILLNPLKGQEHMLYILLWLTPDDLTYQGDENCPLMS